MSFIADSRAIKNDQIVKYKYKNNALKMKSSIFDENRFSSIMYGINSIRHIGAIKADALLKTL